MQWLPSCITLYEFSIRMLPHWCRQPEFPLLDATARGRRTPRSLLCSSGERVRSGLLAFLQLDVLPGTVNKANNWLRANVIVHFVSLWTLSRAIAADILQAPWAHIMAAIHGEICANPSWQNKSHLVSDQKSCFALVMLSSNSYSHKKKSFSSATLKKNNKIKSGISFQALSRIMRNFLRADSPPGRTWKEDAICIYSMQHVWTLECE